MEHNRHAYGATATPSVTPTLSTAGAYSANDCVGTSASPMEFTNVVREAGEAGFVVNAILIDAALQSASTELWLFTANPTPPNDNAAWTITDANALYCIGVIPFSTYYASAANSVSVSTTTPIPFKCASGSTSLYGCLVTRGTPTYATGNLTVRLHVLPD